MNLYSFWIDITLRIGKFQIQLINILTVTVTVASISQKKMLILSIKKSFLMDEYNFDVLKILFWAFSIHLYENPLFWYYYYYYF